MRRSLLKTSEITRTRYLLTMMRRGPDDGSSVCVRSLFISKSTGPSLPIIPAPLTRSEGDTILACSALKRAYRLILLFGLSASLTGDLGPEPIRTEGSPRLSCDWLGGSKEGHPANWPRFFHLRGDKEMIADRIRKRSGHYMPSSLIDSQFEALDEVSDEEQLAIRPATITVIDVSKSMEEVINEIGEILR